MSVISYELIKEDSLFFERLLGFLLKDIKFMNFVLFLS